MSIPIKASSYRDVASAFDRLEARLRAELEPLVTAGRPLAVSSTHVDEATGRATAFGLLKRTDTYVVDAGEGRRAELELRWDGAAPQALAWSLRELGPGAGAVAPGCLGGIAVLLAWVVLLVVKFRTIVEFRGRALALALMGGLLACMATSFVAVGVVGMLFERACRAARPARCRAATDFTARDAKPAAKRAIAAFLAERAARA